MMCTSISVVNLFGPQFSHSSSDGAINSDFGGASALRIISADNFVVTDCKFSQTGMTAIYGSESSNVQITRSDALSQRSRSF